MLHQGQKAGVDARLWLAVAWTKRPLLLVRHHGKLVHLVLGKHGSVYFSKPAMDPNGVRVMSFTL